MGHPANRNPAERFDSGCFDPDYLCKPEGRVTMLRRVRPLALASIASACLIALGQQKAGLPSPGKTHLPVTQESVASAPYTPAYAKDGGLLAPKQYREWIFLSSGIDMSYSPKAASAASMDMGGQSIFDNVFVNPEAYRSFVDRGVWPDKTVLVLEVRGAKSKGSINTSGHYQSAAMMGFEVHVKDEARFPGRWAFFEFDAKDASGTLVPRSAACYSCHAEHAAVDTTFVQFYPTLLPIAQSKGTFSAAYLKEMATADSKPAANRKQQ
jgi:Cytochrome P460